MMKKLLFCFLAAALVLTSCSKDDSLPLPEVSKVEIIGATEGQMKITTGQTVGFSVECENVAIDRYEWIVNEKIESESVRFDFTPAQRGTYDISVNLYNADGGVTTKQIGELQVVDPAPVIASISCNDEALSDPVEVAVGTAVKLTVEVSNVEVASYVWTIDGDTVETATGATLDISASDRSGSRRKTRRLRSISTVPTRTGYGYSARLPADWAFSIRAEKERSTRITCIRPSTAKVRAARTESTT